MALVLLLTACAVGDEQGRVGYLTVADDSEEWMGSSGGDSSGDELGDKTGATPLDSSGGAGIDIDEASTSGDDFGSTDGGSDDGADPMGSTSGGEEPAAPPPPPPPPGTPMYQPCSDGSECDDGVCIRLVDGDVELGSYCSGPCTSPAADCDAPAGSADPVCLSIDSHVVCGLECSGGLSCPAPMQCFGFPSGDYCF